MSFLLGYFSLLHTFYFIYLFIYLFFCLFAVSGAAPEAYGGSQARGPIGAVGASLHQSHSNAGSEQCLTYTTAHGQHWINPLNPLSEDRDRTRNLMVPSQIR